MKRNIIVRNRAAGFTLIEVVIALALLVLISAPILALFAASTRNTVLSANMTAASYFCQEKMEEWTIKDYHSMLHESTVYYDQETNELIMTAAGVEGYPGLYYTIRVYPSGVHHNLFPGIEGVRYAHMVFYNPPESVSPSLIIFAPDGRVSFYTDTPSQMTLVTDQGSASGSHLLEWQGQSAPFRLMLADNEPYVLIAHTAYLRDEAPVTILDISAFTQNPSPGFAFYSDTLNKSRLFSVTPLPPSEKTASVTGAGINDTLLVTIEIRAYMVQADGVALKLSEMVNTVPASLILTS